MECRANGSLVEQGVNGVYTPFCFGWIEVPTEIEVYVARAYGVYQFLWDRPPGAEHEPVRGILYEYIDGETLANVQITPKMAEGIRTGLKGLHDASLAHGDIRASNIIVQNDQSKWLDLSVAKTIPHIRISKQDLDSIQELERKELEIGFALLSTVRLVPCSYLAGNMKLTELVACESRSVCCRSITHRPTFYQ